MQVTAAEFDAVAAARQLHAAGEGWQAYGFGKATAAVERLPQRWRQRLLRRLVSGLIDGAAELHTRAAAWVDYRGLMARLDAAAVPLDAGDFDVTVTADRYAAEAHRVIADALVEPDYEGREARRVAGLIRAPDRLLRLRMFCESRGVEPARVRCGADPGPAIKRMTCPQWWRRRLRAAHARTVEGAAIGLGFVSLKADRYVSDESLARRAQQNRRNARTLERTVAENEDGQRFTLAELAAIGPANKSIRRGELITRIKGFEAVADELGHAAVFVTLTAPSRFHARIRDGSANPKFDGSTPRDAADYLAGVWARIRSTLARKTKRREAVPLYGFRIAEPHGDGTPHQHFVLFLQPGHVGTLTEVLRRYALAESPDEPGAQEHRVTVKPIEKEKGSAVGYVIKYVAKNIDGFRVGDWKVDGDLLGDETLNLSPRVEAWAATWGIRQFQQIGGPPVGLWREMRRVPREAVAESSDRMRDAWLAAQRLFDKRVVSVDGEVLTVKLADFGDFTRAAGGPLMRRKDRPLQLVKAVPEGLGRYGEPLAPRPKGIAHAGLRWIMTEVIGRVEALCQRTTGMVASVRRAWRIVLARVAGAAGFGVPRTRVNNCTVDNFGSVDKSVDNSTARAGPSSGASPPADVPVPTAANLAG